jgi:uncharacterized protein with FMN-binding domain
MHNEPHEPSRFPVRGALGLVGTVGALALLFSFRGAPSLPQEAIVANEDEVARAAEESTAGTMASPGVAETEPQSQVVAEAPVEAVAAEEAVAEPPTDGTQMATGDAFTIRWGDVQVAVTVQGDDIIDVQTLAIPSSDRRSQRINAYAEPVLREEAIVADSSDVSVVSGATYTSQAYAASLQSALDQLGV